MTLIKHAIWLIGAIAVMGANAPPTGSGAGNIGPGTITAERIMNFVKDSNTFTWGFMSKEGLIFQWKEGANLKLFGPESITPQTEEEANFVVTSFPEGYKIAKINIRHGFDPGLNPQAIDDVGHTPRYWLYLLDDKLAGHVWLRTRGSNACPTKLRLGVTIVFVRDDLYQQALKSGEALPYTKNIFSRVVDGNVLTMSKDPNVEVDDKPFNPPECYP